MLRAGFANKTTRLAKNLEEYWEKPAVEEALRAAEVGEDARAEELSLAAWRAISAHLKDSRNAR